MSQPENLWPGQIIIKEEPKVVNGAPDVTDSLAKDQLSDMKKFLAELNDIEGDSHRDLVES